MTVDQAVGLGLFGGEPAVALAVGLDLLQRLTRVVRDELGHAPLGVRQLLGLDGDVGGLATQAGKRLVHHHASVGQREALARRAGGEQELTHAGGHAHAHGGDLAADELHGVVDGHAGRDRATGAVDVQPDVAGGVFTLEVQQLRADLVGDVVVDVGAEHDHPVLEQAIEHIEARIHAAVETHGTSGVDHGRNATVTVARPIGR